jgi:hypothetical protein
MRSPAVQEDASEDNERDEWPTKMLIEAPTKADTAMTETRNTDRADTAMTETGNPDRANTAMTKTRNPGRTDTAMTET